MFQPIASKTKSPLNERALWAAEPESSRALVQLDDSHLLADLGKRLQALVQVILAVRR